MLFNSHTFICLLPCAVLMYWGLTFFKSNSLNILFLLICSLAFYGFWQWQFLSVLVVSISFNYICGSFLIKTKNKKFLFFSIAANISSLFYYKYFNLFKSLTGLGTIYEIILPLGISFFTFTQISYLVDCYNGKTEKSKFFDYALFVTYFPHLIAGPILHHKSMISQFRNKNIINFNFENISIGMTYFIMGLFKKTILADSIMPFVEPVFGYSQPLGVLDAWGGALAYTLQLYFDFSGYSDMAIGISKLFNIDLPINFNSPYKAKSIIDFWKRWHISLSGFLKNYLYIPLGGNKNGSFMKYLNIFIVMCISGIWHGAACTFFLWGVMHGFFLLINHGFRYIKEKYFQHIRFPYMLGSMASWLLTIGIVVIGWVFFRAHSINAAISMTKSMLCLSLDNNSFTNTLFPLEGWFLVVLLSAIALFLPNVQEFMGISLLANKNKKTNKNFIRAYQNAA